MPSIIEESGLRISIGKFFDSSLLKEVLTNHVLDRGGTFTDCVARVPGKDDIVIKILSVDPRNYADAPSEAIRQILEQYHGKSIPRGSKLDLSGIEWIRMGTTVATNALLERKGERTALLITEGFKVQLLSPGYCLLSLVWYCKYLKPKPKPKSVTNSLTLELGSASYWESITATHVRYGYQQTRCIILESCRGLRTCRPRAMHRIRKIKAISHVSSPGQYRCWNNWRSRAYREAAR